MDSTCSPSTKIALNVLNQPACNSALKHVPFIYAECPDYEDNLCKLLYCVGKYLDNNNAYRQGDYEIQYLFCADTKADWQVIFFIHLLTYFDNIFDMRSQKQAKL